MTAWGCGWGVVWVVLPVYRNPFPYARNVLVYALMARPKVLGSPFTVRLDPDAYAKFLVFAAARNQSVSECCRDAILAFMGKPDLWVNPVVSRAEDFVTIKPAARRTTVNDKIPPKPERQPSKAVEDCKHWYRTQSKTAPRCLDCFATFANGVWS